MKTLNGGTTNLALHILCNPIHTTFHRLQSIFAIYWASWFCNLQVTENFRDFESVGKSIERGWLVFSLANFEKSNWSFLVWMAICRLRKGYKTKGMKIEEDKEEKPKFFLPKCCFQQSSWGRSFTPAWK